MIEKLRTLASDTLIYGIFTIIGRFLSFMLTPIYTNYLSMEEVGDITYFFSIIAFICIFNTFGMETSFFRFYSKDDISTSKKVFSHSYFTILAISGTIAAFCFFGSGSIAPSLTHLKNGSTLIQLAALIPFLDGMMVVPYALLRMTRRARRFAITKFLIVVFGVALNVLFVVIFRWHAYGVLLAQLLANLIGVLMLLPELVKYVRVKFDKSLYKQMLRFGLPTLPAAFSAMILQVADRPIMKMLTNVQELGIYQVNYRLGIPMMLAVTMFEYAWKPFYLGNFEEKDAKRLYSRVLTYFTLLCSAVFLIAGLFMKFVVMIPFVGGKFINPEYWSGMGIIPIILGGYYFNGMYTNFAAGFHIEKKTEYLPLAIGIAAIVNIALNFILIPYIGYWGAAWATLIAYAVSAMILYLFTKKIYPIEYEWKRIAMIAFAAVLTYEIAIHVDLWHSVHISFLIRAIALVVYVLILWALGFFTKSEIAGIKRMFRVN